MVTKEKIQEKRWHITEIIALALQDRSEAQLARDLDTRRQTVNNWALGISLPNLPYSIKLCALVGVRVEHVDFEPRDDIELGLPKE